MAVMSDPNRYSVWAEAMHTIASLTGVTKVEFRAAVDAADAWADANQASYNSALPLPARTAMSTVQKTLLLVLVITKRYKVGA